MNSQEIQALVENGTKLIDGIQASDLVADGPVSRIVDVLGVLVNNVVPGAGTVLPMVRDILLPMAEEGLTNQEYGELMEAIHKIEKGLRAASESAMAAKLNVESKSPREIEDYLAEHGLISD